MPDCRPDGFSLFGWVTARLSILNHPDERQVVHTLCWPEKRTRTSASWVKRGKVWCVCRCVIWPVNARQYCVLRLAKTICSGWCMSVCLQRIKRDNFVNCTSYSASWTSTAGRSGRKASRAKGLRFISVCDPTLLHLILFPTLSTRRDPSERRWSLCGVEAENYIGHELGSWNPCG